MTDWAKRNLPWLFGIVFLAGSLAATWGIHLGNASSHVSLNDRAQWQRIEDRLVQIDVRLDGLHQKDCLLAYAIDFPDPGCDTFFQWLDDHPRVRDQVRGRFNNEQE